MRGARPRSPGGEAEEQNRAERDLVPACPSTARPFLGFPGGSWAQRALYLLLADFGALGPEPKSGKVSFSLASSVEEQLGEVYSRAGMRLDASFLQIILRSFV